jgi:ribonuclease VapC
VIVDSSAIVAILLQEPGAEFCAGELQNSHHNRMSAASYLEAAIVADSTKRAIASRGMDELLTDAGIEIEPVTAEQAKIAREAYRDFGKGHGHPARLNFGDCFAYALAKDKREPLLCLGNDFVHTDIATVRPS